jgi:cytidyltransferase-like protein
MKQKKVFVSGCFDMLHSGHVRFLEEASQFGAVHVAIGSDATVKELKGRYPVNTQEERKYMIAALKHVKSCSINRGSGHLDFVQDLKRLSPDIFVVNNDGHTLSKQKLCSQLGIKYIVLNRTPRNKLPARSTTSLRKECRIPYRIDLAGGWLDQPFVSKLGAGPVLTLCVEPTIEFNERSGMASSSRKRAIELWQTDLPGGDPEKSAKLLFAYENPPGTSEFSGSQDAIGIVFPGLSRLDYQGQYWPSKITSITDHSTLRWLEDHLYLVTLGPRRPGFRVLENTRITAEGAQALASAANQCWDAIRNKNLKKFGLNFRKSFEAQVSMFPGMVDEDIRAAIEHYQDKALGWKLSGAGGGGYLILVSKSTIPGSSKITVRREHV